MRSLASRSTAVLCATALLACSSETVIRSNPPGAKVFVDGSYVGTTPYTMSDTKIVGSTTSVRLEYPGYAPFDASIHRSEEFDVVACIGGVFLLVPFLWIMGYKPDHTFELQPGGGGYPMPQRAIRRAATRRRRVAIRRRRVVTRRRRVVTRRRRVAIRRRSSRRVATRRRSRSAECAARCSSSRVPPAFRRWHATPTTRSICATA